jgi:hypothetical protein
MIFTKLQRRKLLGLLCTLFIFSACHNYYQAIRPSAVNDQGKATSIDSLKSERRYFILRTANEEAYNMKNIQISNDQKSLSCTLDTASYNHKLHLVKGRGGNFRYKKGLSTDRDVLNEVHLYVQADTAVAPGPFVLSLDKVQKIEIIEKDAKRTTSSYVIGTLGYTFGALAIVAIIIAATKSSCPFVSAYDGDHFSLQGEIYGGAIYPQLARHDYMPLKMEPLENGSLQLKISNELQEQQYTDMAELWIVTHDKNARVLADEKGNLYNIFSTHAPTEAFLNGKKEVSETLLKAGDNMLLYMDDTLSTDAANEVVMKFAKPADAKNAKLLLSLKNSYFLDLLYGELAKGFGNYYGTYIKQQEKKPAAELLKWVKDQNIPLEVSVNTTDGWKKITDITTIGPLATRDIVVPVVLPENTGLYTEIKLSSGFLFWEIDFAAIDYSQENNFSIQKVTPVKAIDEAGKDILPQLLKEDAVYLAQPAIGNTATITYKTAALKDKTKARTYILHSKGYYEHIRNYTNKPNVAFLNQFKHPGAFPLYGLNLYKQMTRQTLSSLAKAN